MEQMNLFARGAGEMAAQVDALGIPCDDAVIVASWGARVDSTAMLGSPMRTTRSTPQWRMPTDGSTTSRKKRRWESCSS